MSPKAPLGLALLLFSISATASAQPRSGEGDYWDGGYHERAQRRSDFTFGASTGLVLGRSLAYPNEVGKIDDPDYAVDTGLGVGSDLALWLGGALKDWFVFDIGLLAMSAKGSGNQAKSSVFFVRTEAYPFYSLGGRFRDWSVFGTFGAGGLLVDSKNKEDGDGGFVSAVGLGSAFEAFRLGHFAFGPALSYNYLYSQTSKSHFIGLDFRAVFYGGPS